MGRLITMLTDEQVKKLIKALMEHTDRREARKLRKVVEMKPEPERIKVVPIRNEKP